MGPEDILPLIPRTCAYVAQARGLASLGGSDVITRVLAGGRQEGRRDLKMLLGWL